MSALANLFTIGEIARRLGCQPSRIDYAIRSRNIEPAGRVGNLRVFSEANVEHIASELKRIRRGW